jgi:hypothetical protein
MAVKIVYMNGWSSFFLGNSAGHLSRTLFSTSKMNIFRAVLTLLCIIALQAVIAAPVIDNYASGGSSDTDSELSDAETLVDEGDVPDDIGKCKAKAFVENLKKNISQFNKCPHITSMNKSNDPKLDALIMDLPPSSWTAAHAKCLKKKGLEEAEPDSDEYCQCLARQMYAWSSACNGKHFGN